MRSNNPVPLVILIQVEITRVICVLYFILSNTCVCAHVRVRVCARAGVRTRVCAHVRVRVCARAGVRAYGCVRKRHWDKFRDSAELFYFAGIYFRGVSKSNVYTDNRINMLERGGEGRGGEE